MSQTSFLSAPAMEPDRNFWTVNIGLLCVAVLVLVLVCVLGPRGSNSPTPTPFPTITTTLTPVSVITFSRYLYVPTNTATASYISVIDTYANPPIVVKKNVDIGAATNPTVNGSSYCFLTANQKTLFVTNYGGSISVLNVQDVNNISVTKVIVLASIPGASTEMITPDGGCLSHDEMYIHIACNGTLASTHPSGGIAVFQNTTGYPFVKFVTNALLDGPDSIIPARDGVNFYISNTYCVPSTISVWNWQTSAVSTLATFTDKNLGTQFLEKFAISQDGLWLYAVAGFPANIGLPLTVISTVKPVEFESGYSIQNCGQTCVSPDGGTVFAINILTTGGAITPIDITNPLYLNVGANVNLPASSQPYGITCDNQYLYVTDALTNNVYVYSNMAPYPYVETLDVGGVSYWTNDLRVISYI